MWCVLFDLHIHMMSHQSWPIKYLYFIKIYSFGKHRICLFQLAETQRVNATVATQISRLNATLQHLTETLDNLTDLAVDHSNTSLQMADSELAAARDVAQDINDTLSRLVPVRAGMTLSKSYHSY